MKKMSLAAVVAAMGCVIAAAEVPMKFRPINQKNTTIADGVISVANTDATGGGVNCQVNLNQAAPAKIILSGESKCDESLTKSKNAHDYSLYVDITFMDGTKKYGVQTPFSTETNEWQKKTVEFMPAKAIQQLRIYILYRFQTGKAQFKNLKLEEVK
jgi:hypothetical protein